MIAPSGWLIVASLAVRLKVGLEAPPVIPCTAPKAELDAANEPAAAAPIKRIRAELVMISVAENFIADLLIIGRRFRSSGRRSFRRRSTDDRDWCCTESTGRWGCWWHPE